MHKCLSEEALPRDTIFALMITLTAFILSIFVCMVYYIEYCTTNQNLNAAMERTRSWGGLRRSMPKCQTMKLVDWRKANSMIEYLNELFNRLLRMKRMCRRRRCVLQSRLATFFYNTLETISYMAVKENANSVHDALETMGSLLQFS